MGADTLEKPKQAAPSSNYVNKGVQDLENHANQGADKSPGGIRGKVGKQLENHVPGGKAIGGINDLRKGKFSKGIGTLAKEGIKELAKAAIEAAATNPIVQGALAVIVLVLFIVFVLVINDSSTSSDTDPCSNGAGAGAPPDTLTVTNDGPQTAKVGDILMYHIVVADTQQDQEIVIIEHLPDGVSLAPQDITSDNWKKMTVDPTQKTVTWKASENLPPTSGGPATNAAGTTNGAPAASSSGVLSTTNFTINLTLKATADNTTLVTYSEANPTRNTGSNGVSLVSANSPLPGTASNSAAFPQDTWNQLLAMDSKYGTVWTQFLNDAKTVSQQEDYPVAVIIGQAAQETGRGSSTMSQTKNNFFGYKAYDSNPGAASAYATPADSIKDYVKLIKGGNGGRNPVYLEAYANRANPQKMVELIKAGGYATDPNYVAGVTGQPEFKLLAGIPSGAGGGAQLASAGTGGCPGSNSTNQPAGGADAAGFIAPVIDDCGGKYKLTNPLAKNFGDPLCNDPNQAFTKDKLNQELVKDDPTNAQRLYQLAMCESSYNANAYNPNTPAKGAWGLFQVGSSKPPGSPPSIDGSHDRGDVNWQLQVTNAVALLKERGPTYWGCPLSL